MKLANASLNRSYFPPYM